MMEIEIGWSEGITVATKEYVIRFDPYTKGGPNAHNFVSHAHGDHIMGLSNESKIYLTAETDDLLFFGGRKRFEIHSSLKYGEEINFDDLKITAHNAGHILGSAQFEIQSPESSIVYTGDINCRNMLTTTTAEAIPCDILILETTYGSPSYVFPSLEEIYTEIVDWIIGQIHEEKMPVFRVYSTGKAQEIIRLINEFTTAPVVTHPVVSRISKAYEKNGVKLTYIDSNSAEGGELLKSRQCVYVTPNHEETPIEENHALAIATGWAVRSKPSNVDVAFPLSSHADFSQLLNYVEQVKPKRVYTIHGFRDDFGHYIQRKLGIRAQPIIPLSQKQQKSISC